MNGKYERSLHVGKIQILFIVFMLIHFVTEKKKQEIKTNTTGNQLMTEH